MSPLQPSHHDGNSYGPRRAEISSSMECPPLLTNNNQTQRRREKREFSVTFSNQVEVRKTVSLREMSRSQIETIYYNDQDRKACKDDIAKTLRDIRKRNPLDPTTQDTRGLEHLCSREVLSSLIAEKDKTLRSVFDAQDAGGVPDEIARASSEATREATDRALRMAKRDAFEATMQQKDRSNDPLSFFSIMSQSGSS